MNASQNKIGKKKKKKKKKVRKNRRRKQKCTEIWANKFFDKMELSNSEARNQERFLLLSPQNHQENRRMTKYSTNQNWKIWIFWTKTSSIKTAITRWRTPPLYWVSCLILSTSGTCWERLALRNCTHHDIFPYFSMYRFS